MASWLPLLACHLNKPQHPALSWGCLELFFWGVVVTKMALLKHYREFRIALVPHSSTVP